jgi:hypothetical protein
MPFNDKYEEIIVDKRLKGESTRPRDDAFSIFINNTKALLSIIAERDRIDDDEMPDFHTFWKGEGNIRSIREARGICYENYTSASFISPNSSLNGYKIYLQSVVFVYNFVIV